VLKVIDLFSGCGGFSNGFEQAGFEIVAANDLFKEASETYKHNHPNTKFILGDITKQEIKDEIVATAKELGCDGIIGGPPCQAYSLAGNRDPNDPRGKLFNEYVEIVDRVKPSFFVMENVRGILSMDHDGSRVTDLIVQRFKEIGYNVRFKLLNAADYGVPQKRMRVIFLGSKDYDLSFPVPTHSENPVNLFQFIEDKKEWVTVGDAIDDLKELDEDFSINHIFAGSGKDFIEKLKNTKIGESGFGNYGEAAYKNPPDEPAITVKENHGSVLAHYEKNRLMSPRELARLQSFDDDFLFMGTKSKIFTQICNAVPPLLAKRISETIKKKSKWVTLEVNEVY
jgi:DNA (cytosine-5)-methyltransferase 1